MKEFLDVWSQENLTDPDIQMIREKYAKRNPAQMYGRAVKYANDMFEDLGFILSKLPSNYKNKVNLDSGIHMLVDSEIQSSDSEMKLKVAIEKVNAGADNMRDILLQDFELNKLFTPKFDEIKIICNILYKLKTGKTEKRLKKIKQEHDSRTSKEKFGSIGH